MSYLKTAALTWVSADKVFSPTINLVGATVTFNIAVDDPGTKTPIRLQVWAGGDASSGWTWGPTTSLSGTDLTDYDPANGFTAFSTVPLLGDQTRSSGTFCAAATYVVGLQLQNTADINVSVAQTVRIYIGSVTITPPP